MTKKIYIAVSVAVLLALIFMCMRSCKLYDKLSIVKGQNIILTKERAEAYTSLADMKKRVDAKQAQIDSQIAEFGSEIASNERTIATLGTTIGVLENDLAGLTDKDEIIVNLKRQIEVWGESFALLERVVEDKDRIIFSLTEKFESEKSLRITYESVIEQDDLLIQNQKVQIKLLERKYIGSRIGGKLAVAAGVVLGGILAYKMIKE